MKKWLIVLALIVGVGILLVYIFLPAKPVVSNTITIHTTAANITSFLGNEQEWKKWWPADASESSLHAAKFSYNGYAYHLSRKLHYVVEINIHRGNDTIHSTVVLTPFRIDSIGLTWQAALPHSNNPFTRIVQFRKAKALHKNMITVLSHLDSFLSDEKNIYGIEVTTTKVKDTLLVVARKSFDTPPETSAIYKLIHDLGEQVTTQGGKISGYPMMNINVLNSSRVDVMVAIPIAKAPVSGAFNFKRMVPGKILETEIRGGPHNIRKGNEQLLQYFEDHRLESPAIPFQSLITDRSMEPDTSKWITKLYYPIF